MVSSRGCVCNAFSCRYQDSYGYKLLSSGGVPVADSTCTLEICTDYAHDHPRRKQNNRHLLEGGLSAQPRAVAGDDNRLPAGIRGMGLLHQAAATARLAPPQAHLRNQNAPLKQILVAATASRDPALA